jgi:hypothetical protein
MLRDVAILTVVLAPFVTTRVGGGSGSQSS